MDKLSIFNHQTDTGRTVNTLDILQGYIRRVTDLAIQDIKDRHFEVKTDWQGGKYVSELRTSAQILKHLMIDKQDYMFAHRKMLTSVYRSIFTEFNRAYWREEKRIIISEENHELYTKKSAGHCPASDR